MNKQDLTSNELEDAVRDAEKAAPERLADIFEKGQKNGIYAIATYLIEKYHVKTFKGVKRELLVYRCGVYVPDDDVLRKEIREILSNQSSNRAINEIIEAVKDRTVIDRSDFVAGLHLVNLNNGVFNLKTLKLEPHNPVHLFLTKLPVDYNPTADCPAIKKYLTDVLEEEYIPVVQELAGYGLYREYPIKKAVVLFGEGDTGKTTLINLLFAFFGANNVSGISLQKLTHDKFATAHLYEKYINLYDDLSSKDIEDNGSFKIATGGGVISGERKFRDEFQFKNYAKLVFACNKIPDVKDATDDAYFNRWIIIPFTRIIDDEKQDKNLSHKITTSEELSGFLNFALTGLKRLLDQQHFSYGKNASEIKTEMMRSASSIASFVQDCMEEEESAWVGKDDLYHAYTNYCGAKGLSIASKKSFGSRLPMHAPYTTDFKPKDKKAGKQVTAWRNVRLRTTDTDTDVPENLLNATPENPPKLIS